MAEDQKPQEEEAALDDWAAAMETTRHATLSVWRQTHLVLPRGTRRCLMYISTGK